LDILLVNPPSPGIYNWIGLKLPPLGLAYLASTLEQENHRVKIIDLQVEPKKELQENIKNYDLIGITCETNKAPQALKVAELAKKEGCLVVLGGYHATFCDEELLNTGLVDYIVRGEGEYIFPQLVKALENNQSPHSVSGISFQEEGKIVRTPSVPPPHNLDEIPFPKRELLPLSKYWMTQVEGEPLVNMITSRGCPFGCSFCASSQFSGKKWRARSPENVIEELRQVYFDLGYRAVAFVDDNFTLSPARAESICDKIEQEKMKIKWWCFSRADTIVKHEPLVEKMAKAGLRMVYLGFESAEESILQDYGKNLTAEVSKKAVEILRKHGIKSWGSFILGNVRETRETVKKTVEFAKQINPDIVQFSILTPFPGTEIYEKYREEGRIIDRDWKAFDGAHSVLQLDFLNPQELSRLAIRAYLEFYKRWSYLPQAFSFIKKFLVINLPPISRRKEARYRKERLKNANSPIPSY